ncbi:hypothetical protein MJO28_009966 [Puccinia striiformis f. sp. tritici]|uniref:Uncharacterized protein n=1 Tax=Puccinia striiformis f. sp. tritici TaxID=168172 RepID=A0ACC0E9G2_9BASI|nr:hypothetical protein MJO28_009966 [Puccinia striiformis f. sp. tritici]KAI7951054.1 hypothetical protein MJO29_009728 [Puccinia striiformis f. sp. tritici]
MLSTVYATCLLASGTSQLFPLVSPDPRVRTGAFPLANVRMYCAPPPFMYAAALASPIALAPRYYINTSDYGSQTGAGGTSATTVTPWGGNSDTTAYNYDAAHQNSNTAWGPDSYPTYIGGGFVPPGGFPTGLINNGLPTGLDRINGVPSTSPLIGDPTQSLGAGRPGFGSAVFKK